MQRKLCPGGVPGESRRVWRHEGDAMAMTASVLVLLAILGGWGQGSSQCLLNKDGHALTGSRPKLSAFDLWQAEFSMTPRWPLSRAQALHKLLPLSVGWSASGR